MDPLFVASPPEAEIREALELWPELAGKRVRPVLVTAFGDIFVETSAGDVWVASPIELTCGPVASSTDERWTALSSSGAGWVGPDCRARKAKAPVATVSSAMRTTPPQ